MANCGTWATHLEMNSYLCTQGQPEHLLLRELYKPLFMEPAYSKKSAVVHSLHTSHIELAHVDRCHYEVVTMMDQWHHARTATNAVKVSVVWAKPNLFPYTLPHISRMSCNYVCGSIIII